MKRILSLIIVIVMCLGAVPVLGAVPYEVMDEFTEGNVTGVKVKKNDTYKDDFTLYAAYGDGEYVYDVKKVDSASLTGEDAITFDITPGAEIELFAWDDNMRPAEDLLKDISYSHVLEQIKKVNDYYIKEHSVIYGDTNPWDVAVFHTGNMIAYYMTGDELYRNYSEQWSKAHLWQSFGYPVWDETDADNICCFRTYLDLYNMGADGADISYVKSQVDKIVSSYRVDYWNWIDAFYMAAPTFVRIYEMTGDEKYLDKMYEMIKYTAEELNCYDEEEGLWYRDARFITQKSENGEKIFWSRGDGWVYAAFAQIIEELPDSYEHKDYFVDIFLEMSEALKRAQCEKGAWHESLLDKNYNPQCEMSGTGFFTYGMLWGINNGYLDEKEYLNTALRGWRWLSDVALQPDGNIGYVQHVGAEPTKYELTKNSTEDYGYAIFNFAASELAKYIGGIQGDVMPYLNKKLLGNIEIYKFDSPYYIKGGEIHKSTHPMVIEEDGDIKILDVDLYVLFEEYLEEGMYVFEKDGVYVVSEYTAPFNRGDINLLEVLGKALEEGKFPERSYSDPDRIKIEIKEYVPDDGEEEEEPTSSRMEGAIAAQGFVKPSFLVAEKLELTEEAVIMSYIAEPHNGVANALDGNLDTRMALKVPDGNSPEYIEIDLGEKKKVNYIGMSFAFGHTRKSIFDVRVSEDGVNYTTVIPKSYTSGETTFIQYYKTGNQETRYIRIYAYGNSSSTTFTWFSVTELEVYAPVEKEDLPINAVTPSLEGLSEAEFTPKASIVTEKENGPDNVNDGDESTYCVIYNTAKESKDYLELDLGSVKEVKYLAMIFRNGLERQTAFKIDVSEDGINYKNAVEKSFSTKKTDSYEYYSIDSPARYIRIYGYYNTSINTYWVSFNEAKVYVSE